MRGAIQNVLSVIFLCCFAGGVYGQQSEEVILSGYEQVPNVRTAASGVVEVTLESDTLLVEGRFSDLRETYRGAGIFYGKKGEPGNRLLGLKVTLNEDRTSGSFSIEDNRFALRSEIKQALKEGKLYISIASNRFQHGEIHGQIPPME